MKIRQKVTIFLRLEIGGVWIWGDNVRIERNFDKMMITHEFTTVFVLHIVQNRRADEKIKQSKMSILWLCFTVQQFLAQSWIGRANGNASYSLITFFFWSQHGDKLWAALRMHASDFFLKGCFKKKKRCRWEKYR